jgi:hypothetical protein
MQKRKVSELTDSIPKPLETRTKSCFGISGDPATRGRRPFGDNKDNSEKVENEPNFSDSDSTENQWRDDNFNDSPEFWKKQLRQNQSNDERDYELSESEIEIEKDWLADCPNPYPQFSSNSPSESQAKIQGKSQGKSQGKETAKRKDVGILLSDYYCGTDLDLNTGSRELLRKRLKERSGDKPVIEAEEQQVSCLKLSSTLRTPSGKNGNVSQQK